jgi:hypothetical protein
MFFVFAGVLSFIQRFKVITSIFYSFLTPNINNVADTLTWQISAFLTNQQKEALLDFLATHPNLNSQKFTILLLPVQELYGRKLQMC